MLRIINTTRLTILLLTILSFNALPALAFNHGAVCGALWNSMYDTGDGVGPLVTHCGEGCSMGNIAYAEDVVTRDTGPEDPNGEVCGTIYLFSGPGTGTFGASRQCSSHGLGCSGDTCHDGKEWSNCYWNGFTSADIHPLIDGKPYCTAKKVVKACHGLKGADCSSSRINGRSGEPAIQCKLHSDGVCTDGGGECTP